VTAPLEPDRSQIEIFTAALFCHAGNDGFVSVRAFYEGNSSKPFRITPTSMKGGLAFLNEAAVDDARRAAQDPKKVVFCPPLAVFSNSKRAREIDIAEGLALSVECDERPQAAHAELESILGPATVVVRSGGVWTDPQTGEAHDKLHLHWRLREPARGKDALARLKQARDIATRIVGGDPSNKPVCHPIRWPGSWHRKATPTLCSIATADHRQEIDLDVALPALVAAAPKADDFATNQTTANGQDSTPPSDWAELLAGIVSAKSYHDTTVRLAAKLLRSGMKDGAAVNTLRAWMSLSVGQRDERWQTRYDDIPRSVRTAREKIGLEGEHQVKVFWHGDIDYRASRPQLVQDVIPEVGHGLISGQWGTYKTFAALELAHSCMSGVPFLGHEIMRRNGVLFIALEGTDEVPIRLQAVIDDRGKITGPAPFAWIETCPPLIGKNAADEICEIIAPIAKRFEEKFALPLVQVTIDTMIAGAGYTKDGQESDAAATQAVMNTMKAVAKRTRSFVFGVDHFGKAIETGTRGSSAKEGSGDVVIALLGDKSITGEVTNTRLALRKRRGGPNGEEHPFSVRVVAMGTDIFDKAMSTLVIDWGTAHSPQTTTQDQRWSKSLRLLRQVLMNVLVDHGKEQRPYPDGPMVRAVDVEIVRQEFYRCYLAEGDTEANKQAARRNAFFRAGRDAQARGLIATRTSDGLTLMWLTTPEPA
jgi:AAA domain